MATNENLIPIPGRLHSVASDEIVSGANEIYDDKLSDNLENLNTGFTNDIDTIYNTIGDNNEKGAIMEQLNTIDGRLDTIDGEISALNHIPIEVVPLNSAGTAPNVNNPKENTLYRAYNSDHTLYSDWMYQDGSWTMITQLLEPTSLEKLVGYYTCGTAANTPGKEVTTGNSGYVLPANGGAMKIKMINANTADNATLRIGSETAKPLWYNDERASSNNTWEEGEVISIYYDGENYKASNAMGGGSAVGKKKLTPIPGYIENNGTTLGSIHTASADKTNYRYIKYPAKEGDVVQISGEGVSTARLWGIVGEENVILDAAAINLSASGLVLVMPEGTAFITINSKTASNPEWYYAKAGSVGAHEMLTEAYLYRDLRTLTLGQTYEENEAVKTSDKQLLRVTKEVKTMNITDAIAVGDLKTYGTDVNASTYKALKNVNVYNGTETEGLYAIGKPSLVTITVNSSSLTIEEDTDISITIGGITNTIIITPAASETKDADIAALITAVFTNIEGWVLTDNGNGTLTLKCNTAGNNTISVSSNTGETGLLITSSVVNGNSTLNQYNNGSWESVSLASFAGDYADIGVTDNTKMWQKLSINDLVSLAAVQNTLVKTSKAENISYNNSQSGLSTLNVQGALDTISDSIEYTSPTNKSLGTTKGWYINNSNNIVVSSGSNLYRCYTPRVYSGQKFVVKANSANEAYYAFITSIPSSPSSGDTPPFVEGYEKKYLIPAGKEGKFIIPEVPEGTSVYLYIQRDNPNNVFTPEYIREVTSIKDKIASDIYNIEPILPEEITGLTIATSVDDTEITEAESAVLLSVPVVQGELFNITASNSEGKRFIVAFTSEYPAAGVTVTNARNLNIPNVNELIVVPADGYLVISKSTSYYIDLKLEKISGYVTETLLKTKIQTTSDISNIEDKVFGTTPNLRTTDSFAKTMISADSLKWTVLTGNYSFSCRIEPIELYAGKVLVLTKSPNSTAGAFALLSDNETPVNKATPHFSRLGEPLIRFNNTDTPFRKILLTENDKYLYYQLWNSSGINIAPSFHIEELEESKDVFSVVDNFNLTLYRTDYNILEYDEESNPEGINIRNRNILSTTSNWDNSGKGFVLDVSAHKGGYLFISASNNGYYAFLKDIANIGTTGVLPNFATGSGRTGYAAPFNRRRVDIPTDANYVFFGYQNSSDEYQRPIGVFAIGKDIGGTTEVAKTLDIGHIILQKKANQYLNLKWIAKANISGNYVTAGKQTGLLYSSVQEYDRCVGHDVSLKTFMTVANNPYSLLYTENCHTGTTDPDYNRSYHSIGGSTTHGYFGTVCSRFACFANGMDEWSTGHFAWLCKQGYLTKIKDLSAQGVEIGDYVWVPGHVIIVTNYVKSGGVVTSVTITEAAQPLVRTVTRSASQFNDYLAAKSGSGNSSGPGIIYRNNKLYENILYEASPFVAIDDEVPQEYQYNNDICTYAGDYAAFRLKQENDTRNDYEIWLNYNLGDTPSRQWTSIKLFKETYNASNVLSLVEKATYNDVDFTKHKYLIPSTDLTEAGKYRAYLYDGTETSVPTYFEIIETDVTYTRDGENITVEFESANAVPTKVVVETLGGSHRAVRLLSDEEKINGTVTFNPEKLSAAQTKNTYDKTNVYIKVFFKGEYGRVTNAPLKIDYNS